jgi:hypothetical protein
LNTSTIKKEREKERSREGGREERKEGKKERKKTENNKCSLGCGAKGILLHCWQKSVQPLWKSV